MPIMPTMFRRFLLAGSFALGVAACATGPQPVGVPEPLNPQPAEAALRPGLQMLYFHGDFRHVDNMPKTPAELAKGKRGMTVANLAEVSETGKMWDIASSEFYGAHFTGLIKLGAGEHTFVARSNDGVRVLLDRVRVADDPAVHASRASEPVTVAITKTGWYPITVQYFQRRGSARLELLWQPPGASAPSIVPDTVLAHLAG